MAFFEVEKINKNLPNISTEASSPFTLNYTTAELILIEWTLEQKKIKRVWRPISQSTTVLQENS